ncbi:DNA gyrase, A subunit [Propionibacterium acidifaciens F0233]|uniref:DNA topoisomerase (ATP-hydrolyzing) n=1 Tax=Propionibacterium acidifaciens F0233 TaxID=553198 RepID=U2QSL6_9ACTN|nr:DNA gyrase subunit A [Propionibacterium acidifaciens]AYW77779.1 DNA gyrase subunit A [Propionibacterium acidifaciens]ERK59491.1 DNA gyrase, A subunit [Propionibacterium acidifaciens F0233]
MSDNSNNANDGGKDELVGPGKGTIETVGLKGEIQSAFLDYAMSVIVERALPDVRDGLKPVHRRVIYTMYDGGYRPDRGWNKCSRVVGDVMGKYHPHGDSAIYDTLVRLAQPWAMRCTLVNGQGNFGSPGNDGAAAMRYTECRMAPLAMEMVRDIDQDTVDFQPNYDNRDTEPTVLPARFPNLLVNGSTGIAVGMATNIPTHNLREVDEAVQWFLAHPQATDEELLEASMARIKGPDFPGGALIVGRKGIEDAYRTGRGSVIMRAVISIEEDAKGRTQLVITELPYMCNPDNLAQKIADLVNSGRISGIADIRDDTSTRTGQRLVIVLKRDAQPRVVMNNLYKHTQLQDTFGCNMLALVDNVPRTLSLDQFIRYWVDHQLQVIERRTRYQLNQAEKEAHIYRGLAKALDMIDEVIALIRRSPNSEVANQGLQELLDIDEVQAAAILNMQLRRLAALERQKILDKLTELEALIADLKAILASEDRQRRIISTELGEIVDRYGDERRTRIIAAEGDFSEEDFVPDDGMVVTITRGGYAKRTRTDQYRPQRRGGRGVRGATLRADDEVQHLFATTNHQWILFFTNMGRVYRIKTWQLPEGGRDAKGGHVAGLLSFLPGERIAQVLALHGYEDAQYLVLATRRGLVKKTALSVYDSPRQAGLIALNFRDADDELIGAELVDADDDIVLVSRRAQALRFHATDEQLRPMGRTTSGVTGMRFREGDELLSMGIIPAGTDEGGLFVFTVTDGGYAKRTPVGGYRVQNRGGLGIRAMRMDDDRGRLVGGLVVRASDEIIAIKASGQVTRSSVGEVNPTGRDTMGVRFVGVRGGDEVIAIALNPEHEEPAAEPPGAVGPAGPDEPPETADAGAGRPDADRS